MVMAVLSVLKYMYDTIIYSELNTKLDVCGECGYEGEIKTYTDENGKNRLELS